jgi:asparagine synthase (glutamine-hydrolysing)
MCGISGLWQPDGVEEHLLRSMNTVLTHRGPDGEGYYFNGPIGLGHRRLSIIDLAGGRQPLSNEDETVWIVLNGEIYNFPELRRTLEAAGHRFKTSTDTEVIVHLYEEYGTECVRHLRGMFAFAIWDQRRRRLFLARDHVGQKPLFYYHANGVFAFASEIKALLRTGHVRAQMDVVAMNHLISLRYTPETRTLFKDIHKLPAGHWMTVENGKVRTQKYWQLDYTRKLNRGEDDVVAELKSLLLDSVKSHLVSDVPVGAFLSGGIDSSTVASMMAFTSSNPIQTFSIGVRETDFNELPYARLVAGKYNTQHYENIADNRLITLLPKLIWHMDEIADPFGFGVFLVAQLAKSHVKVVLGGDGGDELFGGYDRYVGNRLVDYFCFLPILLRKKVFPSLIRLLPDSYGYNSTTQKLRWLNDMSLTSGGHRYAHSMSYLRFPQDAKELLFSPSLRRDLNGLFDSTPHILEHFNSSCADDVIDKMLYTDMMTRMPEHLLLLVDHMTMAHSLEDRSPLLDYRMVEFAASIPANLKVRGNRLKHIFREVAKHFLPPSLLSRSKQGFSFPLAYWMKSELGNLLENLFLKSRLAEEGYFQRDYMQQLLAQHRSGQMDHNYRLWILLNLELWWRMYIDGCSVETLDQLINEGLSASNLNWPQYN